MWSFGANPGPLGTTRPLVLRSYYEAVRAPASWCCTADSDGAEANAARFSRRHELAVAVGRPIACSRCRTKQG